MNAGEFWRTFREDAREGAKAFAQLESSVRAAVAKGAVEAMLDKARDAHWRGEEPAEWTGHARDMLALDGLDLQSCHEELWRTYIAIGDIDGALEVVGELRDGVDRLLGLVRSLIGVSSRVDVITLPGRIRPPSAEAHRVMDALLALVFEEPQHQYDVLYALGLLGRQGEGTAAMVRWKEPQAAWHLASGLVLGGDAAAIQRVADAAPASARASCHVCLVVALLFEQRVEQAHACRAHAGDQGRLALVRYHALQGDLRAMVVLADEIGDELQWRIEAEVAIIDLAWALEENTLMNERIALARSAVRGAGWVEHHFADRIARAVERSSSKVRLTVLEVSSLAKVRLRNDGLDAALERIGQERAGGRRVTIGFAVLREAVDLLTSSVVDSETQECASHIRSVALAAMADSADEVRDYERAAELLSRAYAEAKEVRSKSERQALVAMINDLRSRLPEKNREPAIRR